MIKRSLCSLLLCTLLSGCVSHLAVAHQDKHETSIALDEVRMELADLKHSLNNTQVELQILDEQVKKDERLQQKTKGSSAVALTDTKSLEKRLFQLEQQQAKIALDLKQLASHASQTSGSLQQYKTKISELEALVQNQNKLLDDVIDLKSALTSLSSASKQSSSSYRVKAGDSLEKIAKNHGTTVEALKKANQLTHNKIMIDQELTIP